MAVAIRANTGAVGAATPKLRIEADKPARVPEWIYCFSDEQFISWCRQHKLVVCETARAFSDEERAAIFRYALRQNLIN